MNFKAFQTIQMWRLGSLDAVSREAMAKDLGLVEVGSSVYMDEAEDQDFQMAVSEEELATIKKLADVEEARDGVVRIATESREIFFYVKGDVVSEVVESNVAIICSWPESLRQQFIAERKEMGNGKTRKEQKAAQATAYGLNPLPWQIYP